MDDSGTPGMKKGGGDDSWSKTLQVWLAGIGIGALVLAAMIVSYEIGTNSADTPEEAAAPTAAAPAAATGPGRELFVSSCGSCHSLAAAETTASVGPDLDDLQPDSALVAGAIESGGAGSGAMPAGLLSGKEAKDVADYVAASSGASE